MPQLKFIKWKGSDFDAGGRSLKPHPEYRSMKLRFPDKSPPLGNPGGPCHVMERIRKDVPSSAQNYLVRALEKGQYKIGPQAELALEGPDLFDKLDPRSEFAWVAISPHAKYRMDLRGVTLPEVRAALKKFSLRYQKESRKDYSAWLQESLRTWSRGDGIVWPSSGIEVVLKVGAHHQYPRRLGILVVTAMVPGNNQPKPVPESSCSNFGGYPKGGPEDYDWAGRVARRYALKIAPTPGITTVVRDDSKNNLPTDLDREKQVALPPGSATPGGAGRDIPQFSYNAPDSGSDIKPRTLGIPGEQYGHPSNDTYNTVTRRTMTSAKRVGTKKISGLAERYLRRKLAEAAAFHGYGMDARDMRMPGPEFTDQRPVPREDVEQAIEYLEEVRPGLLVAYSRGAAVAMLALRESGVKPKVVWLAPAWKRGWAKARPPSGAGGVILHGDKDNSVPLQHSCQLAEETGMDLRVVPDRSHVSILKNKSSPGAGVLVPRDRVRDCVNELPDWGSGSGKGSPEEVAEQQDFARSLMAMEARYAQS